jgi:hypothetical protein
MLVTPYGQRVVSPEKKPISRDAIKLFVSIEPLLVQMGYQIVCPNCARIFGYGRDGVRGNNSEAGPFVVECGCTRHIYDPSEVRH